MTTQGVTTFRSAFGATETMDRLEAEVRARGMTVFARIDHAKGATEAGLTLRPTEALIFGNAKAGTSLMQAKQEIGLDLPLKVLVHEDAEGAVYLSYVRPRWLAEHHGLEAAALHAADAMTAALTAVAAKATGEA
jgi:uncharacterized protein (DUF302 family)